MILGSAVAENPEVILRMITVPQQTESKSARNICYEELRMSRLRRLLFSPIYYKARAFRLCREEVTFFIPSATGCFALLSGPGGQHGRQRLSCGNGMTYFTSNLMR